jgi:hypothetical protein
MMRTELAGRRPGASYDAVSFAAGRRCGTRVAACVARLAAIEIMEGAHWWNRRRRGLMARVLIAHAEEMEVAAAEETELGSEAAAPA